MSNFVTYQIALTAANAALIDQINGLVLGAEATSASPTPAKEAPKAPAKEAPKAPKTPAKEAPKAASGATLDQLKEAVKKAKTDHGVDFINEVFEAAGVEDKGSLIKTVSGIDADMYADIIEALAEGPTAAAKDEPEDDGFGDDEDLGGDDDEPEVTVEAVKTALKAYAKDVGREEAKAIMNKHGAPSLSDVDKCSAKQLAAMFKAMQ